MRRVTIDPKKASDAELLAYAENLSQRLVGSLPSTVDPAAISVTAKIPFKVVSLREALLHRAAELAGVACDLFRRNRVVSAFLITRGLLETAAVLCDLRDRVVGAIDTSMLSELDDFLMRALMGSRETNAKIQALNVMTIVDRVAKKTTFYRNSYDTLSEFAHPNWSGVLASYSKHDAKNLLVNLGADVAKMSPRIGLPILIGVLEAFIFCYKDLGLRLPDFIKLCEQSLVKEAT